MCPGAPTLERAALPVGDVEMASFREVPVLRQAYAGAAAIDVCFNTDVLPGPGSAQDVAVGELAGPIRITLHEAIRCFRAVDNRGCDGFPFIRLPRGSAVVCCVMVFVTMYPPAGWRCVRACPP